MKLRKKVVLFFVILLFADLTPSYSHAESTGIREIITKALAKTSSNLYSARVGISYKKDYTKEGRNGSSFVDYAKDENGNFHILSYGTGLIASESTLVDNIIYRPLNINNLDGYAITATKTLGLANDFRYFADSLSLYEKEQATYESINGLLNDNLFLKDPFANINIMSSTIVKNKIGTTYNLAIDLDKNCSTCKYYNSKNRAYLIRSYTLNKIGLITELVQTPNKYALSEYGDSGTVTKYNLNINYSLNPKFYPPTGKILSSEVLKTNDLYYQTYLTQKIMAEIISMIKSSKALLVADDNKIFKAKLLELLMQYDNPKIDTSQVGDSLEFSYVDSRMPGGVLVYCLSSIALNSPLDLLPGACNN